MVLCGGCSHAPRELVMVDSVPRSAGGRVRRRLAWEGRAPVGFEAGREGKELYASQSHKKRSFLSWDGFQLSLTLRKFFIFISERIFSPPMATQLRGLAAARQGTPVNSLISSGRP